MKKTIISLLVLCAVLGMCLPALASPGDAMIWHGTDYSLSLRTVLLAGRSAYAFFDGGERDATLLTFGLDSRESHEYKLYPLQEQLLTELTGEAPQPEGSPAGEGTGPSVGFDFWFVLDDQIYASISVSTYAEGQNTIDGGYLRRLEMTENGPTLTECDLPRLDYSALISEQEDGWQSIPYVRNVFAQENTLFLLTYDESGDRLCMYDLQDGFCQDRYLQNLGSLSPGPEGKLMVSSYNYADGSMVVSLYDPSADVSEELLTINPSDAGNPQNLCYRAENDTLYYTLNGEIWAAPSFDMSQAVSVNDSPVTYNYGVPQISSDGIILLYDYQCIILRNLDPAVRGSVNLRVADYTYTSAAEQAYFRFMSTRGDVSVILERSYDPSALLQAMLNQDANNDILLLNVGTSQYNALFNRGFLAELDSSEKLTGLVQGMYPAVREAVEKDGHLYALPVYAYGNTMGFDPVALTRLGLTEADLPRTWPDFLRFLNDLPSKLEGTRVSAVPAYYTRQDLKTTLFYSIISSYQNYLNHNSDANYTFNTPVMQETLDLLENLNYEALGVREQQEEEEGGGYWEGDWEDHGILFDSSAYSSMSSSGSWYEPLFLGFGEEKPTLGYDMTVAFINPYSQHLPEALAFLETLADCRETASVYTFSPEHNEATRYAGWEQSKEQMEKDIQEMKNLMAKASEEELPALQEVLEDREAMLKDLVENSWEISPDAIESFHRRADRVGPVTYDFYFLLMNAADASMTEMMDRFYQGECTSQELLEAIDSKYQMIRLEGD